MAFNKCVATLLTLSSLIVMAILTYLVFDDVIKLYPASMSELSGFPSKLEFTLKYHFFPILFLTMYLFRVGTARLINDAADPLSGDDHKVQGQKNVFTNSVEQYLLSLGAQLMLIAHLDAEFVVKAIPLMNILFIVGRIFFAMGYPNKRSFGFSMTLFPLLATVGFCAYKTVVFFIDE